MFFTDCVLCRLRFFPLKTRKGKLYEKIPPKSHKTEIKILAIPGLAFKSGFEQPGPELMNKGRLY